MSLKERGVPITGINCVLGRGGAINIKAGYKNKFLYTPMPLVEHISMEEYKKVIKEMYIIKEYIKYYYSLHKTFKGLILGTTISVKVEDIPEDFVKKMEDKFEEVYDQSIIEDLEVVRSKRYVKHMADKDNKFVKL